MNEEAGDSSRMSLVYFFLDMILYPEEYAVNSGCCGNFSKEYKTFLHSSFHWIS
jgi:hypothetical protein